MCLECVTMVFCPFLLMLCAYADVWGSLDKNQSFSHAGMGLFWAFKQYDTLRQVHCVVQRKCDRAVRCLISGA